MGYYTFIDTDGEVVTVPIYACSICSKYFTFKADHELDHPDDSWLDR